MEFNEKLKKIRTEKGLSQKKLADMIGVSQTAVYSWEKGNMLPKFEQMQRIAAALDVTLDELDSESSKRILKDFFEEINKATTETMKGAKEAVLISSFRSLNNSGQKEALKRVSELTEIKKYTEPDNK